MIEDMKIYKRGWDGWVPVFKVVNALQVLNIGIKEEFVILASLRSCAS